MSLDHERIEELLAGHALGALSGEDAIAADRLLAEHVPSCPLCRETLAGFRAVAAELSLDASAASPPDLILARIRRSVRDARAGRRRGTFVATAAGVAALVGMAALSMSLGTRATRAETHLDRMGRLFDALSQPGVAPVSLQALDAMPMVEVSGPNLERIIVAGHGIPMPARDHVYVIWIGTEAGFRPLGSVMPDEFGFVYRSFEVDPSSFDRILITEERKGPRPQVPTTDSPHMWQATL
jgi:Anti-sigma-K factor rskA